MSHFIKTIHLGAAALAAGASWSQTPPAQPAAQQPALTYSSAFEGYRPFEAGEVQDWRKSNDTVREIGGWRAYAREIQGGAAPSQAQPGAAASGQGQQTKPANPHQGHHK